MIEPTISAVISLSGVALTVGALTVKLSSRPVPASPSFSSSSALIASASAALCFSRSEEQTSELQSLMRISYAGFCLNKKKISHDDIQIIKHHYLHITKQIYYRLC